MLGNLSGWHLLIIIAIILLLFGAPKLPGLARSLGQSMRIFKSEVKQMKEESQAPSDSNSTDSSDSSKSS
ncbi:Sec-independent protein translocase subunit TatA [Aurantimicrobium minutum]|uniref:Sec-independent protein translocase subunit TatA n=1 Tax=Aurantimicrobium minutum TaxID=708131 RepID=UPI002472F038|nr:Sec-independent protein translocase subunit TatA [Aurantimicrobium minutum]MDH6422644.1 sec-independent protein translocase protein TatA [Aurantimicrobium minutum]